MHLTCIKLGAIKKFIDFLQEAMPLRMQKIHILNANYVFDKALAIARVFMKSELMEMVNQFKLRSLLMFVMANEGNGARNLNSVVKGHY